MKKRLKLQTIFVFHGSEPQFCEKNNNNKSKNNNSKTRTTTKQRHTI